MSCADVFIGLGSNQGDSQAILRAAIQALRDWPEVVTLEASPLYLTEPQEDTDQPWFANQVVRLECAGLTPETLLHKLQALETALGRERTNRRYGPRTVDLDLLLFGTEERQGPHLSLPHPRLADRAFVLVPLLDLAPDLCLPDGRTLRTLLSRLEYRLENGRIYQEAPHAAL